MSSERLMPDRIIGQVGGEPGKEKITVRTFLHAITPISPFRSSLDISFRPASSVEKGLATKMPESIADMQAVAWYEVLGLQRLSPMVDLSMTDKSFLYVDKGQEVSPFTRWLLLLPIPIAKEVAFQLNEVVKLQVLEELSQFQDSDQSALAPRIQALLHTLT
ncbi:MAG: hypothetical protein COU66_01625 [Candidatus Pacebacteria bacterium CG10_big_fil_rev_8_21_14_0_10_44_11]|nr:MAG: hypothetical protein COU66_01625 [Candidatus Pacebacteria bacterium CG10_big_fil_rev_8_21_14_0_10_44_11]